MYTYIHTEREREREEGAERRKESGLIAAQGWLKSGLIAC
jgi:hypothetical protein